MPKTAPRGVSDVYLIADARERNVIPFLEDALQEYAHVVAQVNTGDYLICRKGTPPTILAVIERKTLADFAASFKDGRYENLDKMIAMRARTGCMLFFFVEGPAFPAPTRRFARIPYSSILAAMTKLPIRDGVFVVQTEDESHTAKRLTDHLRMFDDVKVPYRQCVDPAEGLRALGAPALAEGTDDDAAQGGDALVVPDALRGLIEESDATAAMKMWARLTGVSVVLGKLLTREFSVADLVGGRVPEARVRALKTATGRGISKDAVDSLLAVRADLNGASVKLVSGLRNVTPAVATAILKATGGLARLCVAPLATVEAVRLEQKSRTVRLGTARATRIQHMLRFVDKPADPEAPPPEAKSEETTATSNARCARSRLLRTAAADVVVPNTLAIDIPDGPATTPPMGACVIDISDADIDALFE
jgi:ERCC4-type nuclease